jgi:hypothetical protein
MSAHDDSLIRVHGEWKGWQTAEVRFRDLLGVHWFQPNQAPHPLVHGYICCTQIVSGEIPHACGRTAPHRLLVCVLRSHTLPTAFAELARYADQHQAAPRSAQAQMPASRPVASPNRSSFTPMRSISER